MNDHGEYDDNEDYHEEEYFDNEDFHEEEYPDNEEINDENNDLISSESTGKDELRNESVELNHLSDNNNDNSKTKALLTSMTSNYKKKLLKIKLNLNGTKAGKVNQSKVQQKRLYIKHDKLDHLFQMNGTNLLSGKEVNIDKLLKETVKTKSKSNESPLKASPIKLSALFSKSIVSKQMSNKKIENIETKNNDHIDIIQDEPKISDESEETVMKKSILSNKDSIALNKFKKYLIKPNENNNLLSKCEYCKLLFLNDQLLSNHRKESCIQKQNEIINSYIIQNKSDNDKNNSKLIDFNLMKYFKCSFCKNIYPNKLAFMSHLVACDSNF
jgi:hypothetical protein